MLRYFTSYKGIHTQTNTTLYDIYKQLLQRYMTDKKITVFTANGRQPAVIKL